MNGRRKWIVLPATAAFLAVVGLLLVVNAAMGAGPACVIQYAQTFNHVVYTLTWTGGQDFGNLFRFGDAAVTGFDSASGQNSWPHDYGYNVGGVTVVTASAQLTSTNNVSNCSEKVTIDDRPVSTATPTSTPTSQPSATPTATQTGTPNPTSTATPTAVDPKASFSVFLPLMLKPAIAPTVYLTSTAGPQWNHVFFQISWNHGADNWRSFYFGDQSSLDIFGSSGNQQFTHDYAYPGGVFTATYTVTNTVGLSTTQFVVLNLHP